MAAKKGDFSENLVRQGVISPDQLAEAVEMAKSTGQKVGDALVRLGYATADDVSRSLAEEHGLDFVNLSDVVIPPSIVELVPE